MGAEWHYSEGDERLGPISTEELKAMAADGRLSPDDLIWREGWPKWTPAWRAKGLFPLGGPPPLPKAGAAPPPLPAASTPATTDTAPEGWWARFTSGKEPWSGGTFAGPIVGTIVIPLIGLAAGVLGLTKTAKRTQGAILLGVGVLVLAFYASTVPGATDGGSGGYGGGQSRTYSSPASQPSLPPGVHDAELWAQVQRDCWAMSHEEKLAAYKMLLTKKQTDKQMEEMRRVFAPIGE